jgi:hypothetical protein
MKLLLRWSFNLACVVSLLICLACAALWTRSYFVGDNWVWYEQECQNCYNTIRSGRGWIRYGWTDMSMMTGINPPPGHFTLDPGAALYPFNATWSNHMLPGYRYYRHPTALVVDVSYAIPFAITAVLPSIWLMTYRRRRRRFREGHCRVCGYDLRASPGRCPECGASPPEIRPDRAHHAVT